jgi:hypothetical protein
MKSAAIDRWMQRHCQVSVDIITGVDTRSSNTAIEKTSRRTHTCIVVSTLLTRQWDEQTLGAGQVYDVHHDVKGRQGSALLTIPLYSACEVVHSLHRHVLCQSVVDVELEQAAIG